MKIEFRPDASAEETRVIICAPRLTDEIRRLMDALGNGTRGEKGVINGYGEKGVERLAEADIVRVYGENQKVYAETERGRFLVRARLYELEASLDRNLFVRISNSEIVNSRRIKRLDASITGTICLHMDNGAKAYASRRHVKDLKKHFGL